MILHIRLKKYKKIPEWQAGFRERRGMTEHIFILNTIIQKQLQKEGGKLFTLFVDLKNAFPSVSRTLYCEKN